MALEERRRDLVVHLTFDRTAHYLGLVLSGSQDHDLAGLEYRRHAHRDGLTRYVLISKEVGRRILPGHEVEGDEAGTALKPRPGLVEPDMAGATDPQNLEIDAPNGADRLLVSAALLLDALTGNVARRMCTLAGGMSRWEKRFSHMNRW